MGRSAHRHPYVCRRCLKTVIDTTLGWRWWDPVEKSIVHAYFVRQEKSFHFWTHRPLVRTNVHEIACATQAGETPVRDPGSGNALNYDEVLDHYRRQRVAAVLSVDPPTGSTA